MFLRKIITNYLFSEENDDQAVGLQKLRNMIQTIKTDQEKLVLESDLLFHENQDFNFSD